MWRWLARSLRPTVIWQIKAVCGRLSFEDILLGIQKKKKITNWFSVAESFFLQFFLFFLFIVSLTPEPWNWCLLVGVRERAHDGDLLPGGRSRHGCVGPPATSQMSRDQDSCSVWLMKFGSFTASQSSSFPRQFFWRDWILRMGY